MKPLIKARILFISAADPRVFGGQEKQTLQLISSLQNDYQFMLVAEKGRLAEISTAKVFYRPLRRRNIWRSILEVRDIIVENNIDIVHTLEIRGSLIGRLASRLVNISKRPKVLATRHELFFSPHFDNRKKLKRRLYALVEKLTGRYCDYYITVSEAAKNELVKRVKVSENKVAVVYCGQAQISANPTKQHDPVVGFVGRLEREKGLDELADAAKIVLEKNESVRFVIVGGGSCQVNFEDRLKRLGIINAFNLVGFLDDPSKQMADFKLLVLPSWHECFPNVILEAFQRGIPVVASNVGGIPELIKDQVNGRLVEPRNPDQLSAAILELSADEGKYQAMAGQAVLTAANFTVDKMVADTKAVYDRLLEKRA